MGSCEVQTDCPAMWVSLFGRLRSLVIRITEAQQLISGRVSLLRSPNSQLRSLRLTAANTPGSPAYVAALVGSLVGALQLEEFGCESRHASEAIVDGVYLPRVPPAASPPQP